jgi:hypothetical protein
MRTSTLILVISFCLLKKANGRNSFNHNTSAFCGFGIFPCNKPDSFMKTVKKEPVFIYPNVFPGVKF